MKKRQLESFLQQLDTFTMPRLELEQYATDAPLAASILEAIELNDGHEDALVGDLGCGCGIFMLGAVQLGAELAVGFDIDPNALDICRTNVTEMESEHLCDLVAIDLASSSTKICHFNEKFDLIITNPPFGTKNNAGIDIKFVQQGLSMLRPSGSLYSLHKTSTRDFILKKAKKEWKNVCNAECIAQLRWNLDKTYRHQKLKTLDIEVDLFRFQKL